MQTNTPRESYIWRDFSLFYCWLLFRNRRDQYKLSFTLINSLAKALLRTTETTKAGNVALAGVAEKLLAPTYRKQR